MKICNNRQVISMSERAENISQQLEQPQNQPQYRADKQTIAAALRYDPEQNGAPLVVASGRGDLARQIIETARQAGVAIYQDEQLARALVKLPPGQEIPPALYQAVAQVLVYLANLDREFRRLHHA